MNLVTDKTMASLNKNIFLYFYLFGNINNIYMEDRRSIHLKELVTHKKILIDSCYKLATYFLQNGNEELALNIMRRAFVHDISKISADEFHSLNAFGSYSKYSINKDISFSEEEKIFLNKHWAANKHHPEHWTNINDMEEIDLIEMVCDWHARSVEFENDLLEYIEHRQKTRFAFPEPMLEKIIFYAKKLIQK